MLLVVCCSGYIGSNPRTTKTPNGLPKSANYLSSPCHSSALHFVGELHVLGVNIELPLPLTQNAGEYRPSVDSHPHVHWRVCRLLHVPEFNKSKQLVIVISSTWWTMCDCCGVEFVWQFCCCCFGNIATEYEGWKAKKHKKCIQTK